MARTLADLERQELELEEARSAGKIVSNVKSMYVHKTAGNQAPLDAKDIAHKVDYENLMAERYAK